MVIYADILVLVNLIVDYFLLLTTSKILSLNSRLIRVIFSSLIGGLSSLYIFVSYSNLFLEIIYRIIICGIMVFTAFGFRNIRVFLRGIALLFAVTFGYGGVMQGIWQLFRPNGMAVINSVVYFNISPTVLIGVSVSIYLLFTLFYFIFGKTASSASRCQINIFAEGKSVSMTGIIDTGNSLEDFLGGSEIIIADEHTVSRLFGSTDIETNESLKSRYRIIPCGTAIGDGSLDAFRCDKATVNNGNETITLNKPLLAVSKMSINDDYSAIVNPKIFK